MKSLVNKIYNNPAYAKAFHLGKVVTITGTAQILVQTIGFVCGILIIRLLSIKEYAFYTIANTMLGTIVLLSDAGIAAGVMALGGKVWDDRSKLGVIVVTGLRLRKKFAVGSLIISLPILLYLLLYQGANIQVSMIIIFSLIPVFFASLSDTILEIPLKLKQAIVPLQKNQLTSNMGRLILTGLTLFIFPWSFIALIAGGLPRIYANFLLYKKANEFADLTQEPDPAIKSAILSMVKRILPGAFYFCISGQITIWLISIFGDVSAIAQVGALGRITMILSIITSIFSTLVIPKFSTLKENTKLLLYKFIQIQLTLLLISFFIVGSMLLFSDQFLFILGNKYSGLNMEIILMTISSCIAMMAGITHSISLTRGWVLPPLINVLGSIVTQVLLIIFLDMSSLKNIILLSIWNSAVAFMMLFFYFIFSVNVSSKK